jgi:hypothetical protein
MEKDTIINVSVTESIDDNTNKKNNLKINSEKRIMNLNEGIKNDKNTKR